MTRTMSGPGKAGVVSPYALVEVKLGRAVNWAQLADRKKFIEAVLGFSYHHLFDPKHGSPLYPGLRFDRTGNKIVGDVHAPLISAHNRLKHLDTHVLSAGGAGGTTEQWVDPGVFFTHSADFIAPVQGNLPDCHFFGDGGAGLVCPLCDRPRDPPDHEIRRRVAGRRRERSN
jgi:hypothetical protein